VTRWLVVLLLLATACVNTTAIAPPTPTPTASVAEASAQPTATPAPTVVGMRIRIPRLGIDLPLQEGDQVRDVPSGTGPGATPEGAAFHFPGTAVPGQVGNSFVYAHARVGMFLSLWRAAVGDRVEIGRPDGSTLAYTVAEVHPAVPSKDTSWLQPTDDERLTLQTSTGPTPAYPRFIVVARRD
jgi:sortase (surface protein transpeptidase)